MYTDLYPRTADQSMIILVPTQMLRALFTPMNSYCKIIIHHGISRFILSPIGLGSNMRKSLFRKVLLHLGMSPPSLVSRLLSRIYLDKGWYMIGCCSHHRKGPIFLSAFSKIPSYCMRYLCNADFTLHTSGAMRTISMISESHTYWTRLKAAAKIVSWVWLRHPACCSDLIQRYTPDRPTLCICVVPCQPPVIGTPTKLGASIPWQDDLWLSHFLDPTLVQELYSFHYFLFLARIWFIIAPVDVRCRYKNLTILLLSSSPSVSSKLAISFSIALEKK